MDLYVVTKDDYIPQNWDEKNEIYLKVARKIRDIRKSVPIDLIVHTKRMHGRFIEIGSSFSKELLDRGVRLL
ncbi:hypothetical protein [Sedimentisphaera cyanobacteriorum]|uniref:hypothetical protein n=1 Tax=Sedimentisphaera cyanobacteriorum TaxID=1940790 RepID=UPI001D12CC89